MSVFAWYSLLWTLKSVEILRRRPRKVEFRRAHVRVHVPRKGQVELIVVALARAKEFIVALDVSVVRLRNLAEIRYVSGFIRV